MITLLSYNSIIQPPFLSRIDIMISDVSALLARVDELDWSWASQLPVDDVFNYKKFMICKAYARDVEGTNEHINGKEVKRPKLSPLESIRVVWHAHLLRPRSYVKLMMVLFPVGEVLTIIDYFPDEVSDEMAVQQIRINATIEWWSRLFGKEKPLKNPGNENYAQGDDKLTCGHGDRPFVVFIKVANSQCDNSTKWEPVEMKPLVGDAVSVVDVKRVAAAVLEIDAPQAPSTHLFERGKLLRDDSRVGRNSKLQLVLSNSAALSVTSSTASLGGSCKISDNTKSSCSSLISVPKGESLLKANTESTPGRVVQMRMLVGRIVNVDLLDWGSDTVDELKARLAEKEGIPVKLQRLIYQGKEVHNGHTMGEYGSEPPIGHPIVIHVIVRVKGKTLFS